MPTPNGRDLRTHLHNVRAREPLVLLTTQYEAEVHRIHSRLQSLVQTPLEDALSMQCIFEAHSQHQQPYLIHGGCRDLRYSLDPQIKYVSPCMGMMGTLSSRPLCRKALAARATHLTSISVVPHAASRSFSKSVTI
jgi:hypothetical protein